MTEDERSLLRLNYDRWLFYHHFLLNLTSVMLTGLMREVPSHILYNAIQQYQQLADLSNSVMLYISLQGQILDQMLCTTL